MTISSQCFQILTFGSSFFLKKLSLSSIKISEIIIPGNWTIHYKSHFNAPLPWLPSGYWSQYWGSLWQCWPANKTEKNKITKVMWGFLKRYAKSDLFQWIWKFHLSKTGTLNHQASRNSDSRMKHMAEYTIYKRPPVNLLYSRMLTKCRHFMLILTDSCVGIKIFEILCEQNFSGCYSSNWKTSWIMCHKKSYNLKFDYFFWSILHLSLPLRQSTKELSCHDWRWHLCFTWDHRGFKWPNITNSCLC